MVQKSLQISAIITPPQVFLRRCDFDPFFVFFCDPFFVFFGSCNPPLYMLKLRISLYHKKERSVCCETKTDAAADSLCDSLHMDGSFANRAVFAALYADKIAVGL